MDDDDTDSWSEVESSEVARPTALEAKPDVKKGAAEAEANAAEEAEANATEEAAANATEEQEEPEHAA